MDGGHEMRIGINLPSRGGDVGDGLPAIERFTKPKLNGGIGYGFHQKAYALRCEMAVIEKQPSIRQLAIEVVPHELGQIDEVKSMAGGRSAQPVLNGPCTARRKS